MEEMLMKSAAICAGFAKDANSQIEKGNKDGGT